MMETEVEGQRVRLGWGRDLQRCVPSLTLFFLFFLFVERNRVGSSHFGMGLGQQWFWVRIRGLELEIWGFRILVVGSRDFGSMKGIGIIWLRFWTIDGAVDFFFSENW